MCNPCLLSPAMANTSAGSWRDRASQEPVALETEALARSIADVERALRLTSVEEQGEAQQQLSPSASSTYGKLMAFPATPSTPQQQLAMGQQRLLGGSPLASSLDVGDQTRADSRNTNQSFQNGPALVDEMTLSDLEDEISSSLMATREARASYRSQQREHKHRAHTLANQELLSGRYLD